jgi:outer membrane protein assembly factor BamB
LANDRIFVTAFENDKLAVLCLDRKTGKLLWRRDLPRTRQDLLRKPNNAASPSPVSDGKNVYAFFQDFGLISFDANGKERWRLPMGPFNVFWGFGASPILVDGLIVLPADQDTDSFIIAVEKDSGKVRWKVSRPDVVSGYSTPIVYRPKNGPAEILVPEAYRLSAYSLKDGHRAWWVQGLAPEMKSIASHDAEWLYINGWGLPQNQPGKQIKLPPFAEAITTMDADGDGKISKAEGKNDPLLKEDVLFQNFDLNRDGLLDARDWENYRASLAGENGLLAIRMGGRGDMTQGAVRWKYTRPVPQVPSTLLYQNVLFMVNDSGILLAFNPATGDVLKQGRLKGAIDKYFASPVGADGKVFLISQNGTVSVVKAAGDWEILAVNELGEDTYATPAIADGKIYIRTSGTLYCFGK